MFSEHGIPEVLHSDNGPQYVSAQFADFCTSWGITHESSSPYYLQSNGFTEACVKSMKHALQHAKYNGANLQLALLALQATSIDAKLQSPAELLYQCQLTTTIPAKICNTDPVTLQVHEQITTCSDASKYLAPLYAGQPIAMYDTLCMIWISAMVVCILPKDSYQVCTRDGMVYCCTRWHLCECSVKPTDTVPDTTTATLQAAARPHISAPQPTPAKPAKLAQPLPVAPAMPVTPKPQTTAVPTMLAAPKLTPASTPVTPSAAPVHQSTWFKRCNCPTAHERGTQPGTSPDSVT